MSGFRNPTEYPDELTAAELLWLQTANAGVVLLDEQASSPSPTTGFGKLYSKNDNGLYYLSEAGVEYQLAPTSGSGVIVETPTGTINSVNTSFTVTAQPKWVVSDGVTFFSGAGYSYAALVITMEIPPSQYIRAII